MKIALALADVAWRTRCVVDHPNVVRRGVLHSLHRPSLGAAHREFMELRSEELLYPVVSLHHFHHDASVREDTRTRKGMEIGRHMFWRRHSGRTHRDGDLPAVGGHNIPRGTSSASGDKTSD